MLKLDISADLKPLQRAFTDFQKKQVPWATALAVTRLAQGVVGTERAEMAKTFDTPTPFTLNSITMKSATKADPTAIVFPKDIAAAYLEPYVVGGKRSLGSKKGMLVPKGVSVNQYGNLTRNKLQTLKSKPGVFIGTVQFKKSGQRVSGVWQRVTRPTAAPRRGKGSRRATAKGAPAVRSSLKLLVRFSDATEVPRRLPFHEAARIYLQANYEREFAAAMRQALATAHRQ